MSDDVTLGELGRRLHGHEERSLVDHQAIHDRISRVSSEAVQVDVHDRIEHDRDREYAALTGRVSRLEEKFEARPGITWGRVGIVLTITVAVLALLLQAYSAVQGTK